MKNKSEFLAKVKKAINNGNFSQEHEFDVVFDDQIDRYVVLNIERLYLDDFPSKELLYRSHVSNRRDEIYFTTDFKEFFNENDAKKVAKEIIEFIETETKYDDIDDLLEFEFPSEEELESSLASEDLDDLYYVDYFEPNDEIDIKLIEISDLNEHKVIKMVADADTGVILFEKDEYYVVPVELFEITDGLNEIDRAEGNTLKYRDENQSLNTFQIRNSILIENEDFILVDENDSDFKDFQFNIVECFNIVNSKIYKLG